MSDKPSLREDQFELYDLSVVVEEIGGHCICAMAKGDCFYLRGGKISLPDGADFCLYALQSAIPLLPAKQRKNHPADWMETDARVICPDPACRLIMRIDREAVRVLDHDAVSAVPRLANRQVKSLPSEDRRARVQSRQKGSVTEEMKPTSPPPSSKT